MDGGVFIEGEFIQSDGGGIQFIEGHDVPRDQQKRKENMGSWTITVKGLGCHHNGSKYIDADLAAQQFVADLIGKQNHQIAEATFDTGGGNTINLLPHALIDAGKGKEDRDAHIENAAMLRKTYFSAPTDPVAENKHFRKQLDDVLQLLKESGRKSRNRSLAIAHLEDTIMRLGMDLKEIGETPNPYPHSYDASSPVIDKTADGLKL